MQHTLSRASALPHLARKLAALCALALLVVLLALGARALAAGSPALSAPPAPARVPAASPAAPRPTELPIYQLNAQDDGYLGSYGG